MWIFSGFSAVEEITRDFADTLSASTEVTAKYQAGHNAVLRVAQCVMRLFAPLL